MNIHCTGNGCRDALVQCRLTNGFWEGVRVSPSMKRVPLYNVVGLLGALCTRLILQNAEIASVSNVSIFIDFL